MVHEAAEQGDELITIVCSGISKKYGNPPKIMLYLNTYRMSGIRLVNP
jgi:hypothetical protein